MCLKKRKSGFTPFGKRKLELSYYLAFERHASVGEAQRSEQAVILGKV
jgi:hypothetical protein